jgi:hypothetical protein
MAELRLQAGRCYLPLAMGQVLVGSILVVPLLIARFAAGWKSTRRGFRWALLLAFIFHASYALFLIYIYFKLA